MSVGVKQGYSGYGKNPTLYIKNVPEDIPKQMLVSLFLNEPGFIQVMQITMQSSSKADAS